MKDKDTKTHLDNRTINVSEEFPKVDFKCLTSKFPVTLKARNMVERTHQHLGITRPL